MYETAGNLSLEEKSRDEDLLIMWHKNTIIYSATFYTRLLNITSFKTINKNLFTIVRV